MVLIFGAGFIGKALYTQLNEKGVQVKLFSRSQGDSQNNNRYTGDISEVEKYPHLFDGVHTIVHAIHTTVPSTSYANDLFDIQTNVLPFLKILKMCENTTVENFIYISSGGAVYGNPVGKEPVKEDHVTQPVSSYGITKLMCEKYLTLYKDLFKGNCVILRPSNVFGKNQFVQRPQGLIGHILDAIENNKNFHIWGDGNTKKDYLHLDDLVSAIECVLNNQVSGVFNVSSGNSCTIKEIINEAEKTYGKELKTEYHSFKPFDVKEILLDAGLFRKTFNWESKKALHQFILEENESVKNVNKRLGL